MFCEKCGNELNNNQSICPNCSKSISKKIVLFATVVIFIIATTFTVLASTSDIFKSPKKIYLNTEKKNFENLVENLKDEGSFIGNLKTLSEYAHQTENEFSVHLDIDNAYLNSSPITKILDNSKLIINKKANPDKDQRVINADILVNNAKLIDIMAALENDVLTLSVPVLFDKYVITDFKELEKLLDKLGYPQNSNLLSNKTNIITPSKLLNLFSFDENKIDNIINKYSKVLEDSINKEQISIDKNVDFTVGEFDFKCDKLTIKFEKSDLQRIIINLVDATAENEDIYQLIKDYLVRLYGVFEDSNSSSELGKLDDALAEFTQEKFKENVNELKISLEKTFENLELPEGISISIFKNKKKIIGRTVNAKFKNTKTDETFSLYTDFSGVTRHQNKNIKNLETKLTYAHGNNEVKVTLEYDLDGTLDKENESGKKNFSIGFGSGGISTKVLKLNADYSIISDSKSNSVKDSHDYNVEISIPMLFSINANGNLVVNLWKNPKQKQFGRDIDFSLRTDIPGNMLLNETSIDFGFNAKSKNTLDIDFNFPVFDSDNSIDIVNSDEDEISQMIDDIKTSLTNFVQENQDLINLF